MTNEGKNVIILEVFNHYKAERGINMISKCKYCGKETFGPVCPACLKEGNEILHTLDICEKLNGIYGIFGLLKLISFLGFVISFILVLCLKDTNLQHAWTKAMFAVGMYGGFLTTALLRQLFNKKINLAIDTELKRRHKK